MTPTLFFAANPCRPRVSFPLALLAACLMAAAPVHAVDSGKPLTAAEKKAAKKAHKKQQGKQQGKSEQSSGKSKSAAGKKSEKAKSPAREASTVKDKAAPFVNKAGANAPVSAAPGGKKSPLTPIDIKGFVFEGNQVIGTEELQALVQSYVNTKPPMTELRKITGLIAAQYRERGYVGHAYVKPESLDSGHLVMVISEAKLGAVRVSEGSQSRLPEETSVSYITHQNPVGDPLQPPKVDKGVRILNEVPGVGATAAMTPGVRPLETDVILNVQDKPVLTGLARVDNAGSKATGRERGLVTGALNNRFGWGEQFSGMAMLTQNSQYLRLGADMPVGPSGLRAGVSVGSMQYKTRSVTALDNKGSSTTLGTNLSYPLMRTTGTQVTATAGWEQRNLLDNAMNVRMQNRKNSASVVGIAGTHRSAVGLTSFGAGMALGRLQLEAGSAELAADQAGPMANGSYQKITWNLGHQWPLGSSTELLAAGNGQFASKNLDAGEKFALGGPQGIRAYLPLEGSGDQGWLGKMEIRHNISGDVRFLGFVDVGHTQVNKTPYATWNAAAPNVPNSYWLYGTGLGVQWQAPNAFEVSATLATPIGSNPGKALNPENEANLSGRTNLWVNVQRPF